MFTLGAVGFLIGSLLPERMARRFGLGRAILLAIADGPSELLVAFASGPPTVAAAIAAAGFFLTGLTIPTYDVNQFSLRQAVTPLRLQGRVSATMRTLIRGLVPIGALLGGFLAERFGLREVMIVSALAVPRLSWRSGSHRYARSWRPRHDRKRLTGRRRGCPSHGGLRPGI